MKLEDVKPLMKIRIPTTRRGTPDVTFAYELRKKGYNKEYVVVHPIYHTDPTNLGLEMADDVKGWLQTDSDSFDLGDLVPYEEIEEIYQIY